MLRWSFLCSLVFILFFGFYGKVPVRASEREEPSVIPSWKHVKESGVSTLSSPLTYGPMLGAAVIGIAGWDEKISDWATEKNPIYGSDMTASHYSDHFKNVLMAEALITSIFTYTHGNRSPRTAREDSVFSEVMASSATISAGEALLSNGLGISSTASVVGSLKWQTGRKRPNGHNDNSFPSMHTALSMSFATLSAKNMENLPMGSGWRTGLTITSYTMAAAVGWGRIEGNRHYPTDVLVGAALGHFISGFIYESFLRPHIPQGDEVSLDITPSKSGVTVGMEWSF